MTQMINFMPVSTRIKLTENTENFLVHVTLTEIHVLLRNLLAFRYALFTNEGSIQSTLVA